jgi:type IX secretion system PorP/SprF family membrane protein
MKRTILTFIILGSALCVSAQQRPHYTQYILNQYIINPALSGIENYTDIKISHRHQWVGIEDAPVTTYVTAHMPLGKSDYRTTATSFSMEGSNPRGREYWDTYSPADPHHGIGIQFINDRTGPITHQTARITYAYHMGLTNFMNLAAGFGIGISRVGLNGSKLNFATTVDPAVYSNAVINKNKPDVTAGLYLYSRDFFVGVSAEQVVPQELDFSNNAIKPQDSKLVPHIFSTAGYRFMIGEEFNVVPSVMVKYLTNLPTQVDFNTKVQYLDFLWAGVGYRLRDGFTGLIGLNIADRINATYSYDYTTSGLSTYSKGTHEVTIGFTLGRGFDSCPRNVW